METLSTKNELKSIQFFGTLYWDKNLTIFNNAIGIRKPFDIDYVFISGSSTVQCSNVQYLISFRQTDSWDLNFSYFAYFFLPWLFSFLLSTFLFVLFPGLFSKHLSITSSFQILKYKSTCFPLWRMRANSWSIFDGNEGITQKSYTVQIAQQSSWKFYESG